MSKPKFCEETRPVLIYLAYVTTWLLSARARLKFVLDKEDRLMDTSTPTTATQLILLWTLLGFLLIWMITFAVLALRPAKKAQPQERPAAARPVPAFPTQSMLYRIASRPLEFVETGNPEAAGEVGASPVT